MNIKVYTPFEPATISEKEHIVNFLFHHLDQYGDAREDIHKAIQYALKETASHGGFVIAGELEGKIVGAGLHE